MNPPDTNTPEPTPINLSAESPLSAPVSVQPDVAKAHAPAGRIILQWMTYALWGWSLLALAALTFLDYFSIINKNDDSTGALPYALSAAGVLVISAFVCDWFYRKQEPVQKRGFEMVIMIVHAVIFALISIGTLVAALISLLTMALSVDSTSNKTSLALVLSWATVAILYGVTFLRTLNPSKLAIRRLPFLYDIAMLVVAVIFMGLALAGPLVGSLASRNDRRIDAHLSTIQMAIGDYVRSNGSLPNSLDNLKLTEDAKGLVSDKLVDYQKDTPKDSELRYQLCVTYSTDTTNSTPPQYYPLDQTEYKSYLSTSGHSKGRTCYKLYEYSSGYGSGLLDGTTGPKAAI